MKNSIIQKLESLAERFEEAGKLLAEPDAFADQQQFRNLSIEFAKLEPVVKCFRVYQQALNQIQSAQNLLQDPDQDMRAMAEE